MGNNQTPILKDIKPRVFLITGGGLLLAYFLLAAEINFFVDPDLAYVSPDISRVPWGSLEPSYIRYIPYRQLSSLFWKIFLLFPATLFLTLFLSLKGNAIMFSPMAGKKNIPLYLAFMAMVIIILLINLVFRQTPITDDEPTYDLQAKILLKGKLYAPPPPVEESFDNWFVITKGKYTGKYTIGHPLFLALGSLLGSPYIFPVLFSGALLLLIYQISWLLYEDKKLSLLAAFLLLISPFYLFTSATRLSHSINAFLLAMFMLSFLLAIEKKREGKRSLFYSLLGGLCLGYAFNIRPLSAIGFASPFVAILLLKLMRQKLRILPEVLSMALGFFFLFWFTLWCNKQITGNWFEFPFHYYNPQERFGFGAMLRENHYTHTPWKAVVNLCVSAVRMNIFLFGIPFSLIFLLFLLIAPPLQRNDKLCLAIIGSFCLAYFFYYSPGVSETGPIYYYELIIPLIILSARGILLLHNFLRKHVPELKNFVGNFTLLSILLAVITFYPERILHLLNLTDKIREPYQEVQKKGIHNAVVFIHSLPLAGWVFGFRNNSPDFNDDVLFCRLLNGAENLEVVRYFPNREYYVLYYDSTKGKSEIKNISPDQLARIKYNNAREKDIVNP